MNDRTEDLPLASEFPPAGRDDWLQLVRAALKDRPFERLISRTYDGIPIEPLYPRAAGAQPVPSRSGRWQVMQRVDHPDPAAANAEALADLENGADALVLVFRGAAGDFGFGLDPAPESIARVLDGVLLEAAAVELDLSETSKHAADHVAALVKQRGLSPEQVDIRFGHDPIGAHARTGTSPLPWRELGPLFGAHVAGLAAAGFRGPLACADGRAIHNAGGSEAQELAFAIAVAADYLRALEAAGVPLARGRAAIQFRLTADADQFLTMAKFRALRLLWARVEEACGLAPARAFVTAETSWRMTARHDPHVNMLRATVATFAAGTGGADAIGVLPFTVASGLSDRFARRVARNTQLILLEESNLHRVRDPAAGAGGIEALTGEMCRSAWALFQEMERAGGAGLAMEAGVLQEKVAAVRAARELAVAHRRDPLTGSSDYPNLAEAAAQVLAVPPAAAPDYPAAVRAPPLPRMRLAEPFEALRDASDRERAATGARPRVFLANIGPLAEFTARATFAKNFFEAGGIEALGNDGFKTEAEMAQAFRSSGAALACLCSSDAIYETEAAGAARALAGAGARRIYLAGRPKDEAPFRAAGVGGFVFTGCNALMTLREAHGILGLDTEGRR